MKKIQSKEKRNMSKDTANKTLKDIENTSTFQYL